MLYKPNYCCNCGDMIERIDWNILTSRRFCSLCETEFVFVDWFTRASGVILVLLGFFGFGSYLSDVEKPLEIRSDKLARQQAGALNDQKSERRSTELRQLEREKSLKKKSEDFGKRKSKSPADVKEPEAGQVSSSGKGASRPRKVISEPIYYCGAETKKGSPCLRRVKGGGRCWQHKDRKAVLQKKDLVIKN